MRHLLIAASALSMLLAAVGPARAQLAVDRLWVDLDSAREPRGDVLVRNDSADRYYITVQVSEIENPGEAEEKRITNADPEAVGLLVTPNRMIMEPGSQRSIRLVSLNPELTKDRVYRILISPSVGDLQTEAAPEGGRGMAVKILTAFEVLVIARPVGSRAQIVAERLPNEIVIRNMGATNALLYDGFVCNKGDRDTGKCTSIPVNRLYAGEVMHVPITAPDQVVTLKQRTLVSEDPVDLIF